MAQAGDQPFMREAPLHKQNALSSRAALRPADILLRAWQGGKDLAVDVTVFHPLQAAQQPWTAEKAKGYLTMVERRKLAKYDTACSSEGLAFLGQRSTCGGMGLGARAVLHKLLRRAVGGVPLELRALRTQEHRQHLSLALMRQVWRLLRAKNTFA